MSSPSHLPAIGPGPGPVRSLIAPPRGHPPRIPSGAGAAPVRRRRHSQPGPAPPGAPHPRPTLRPMSVFDYELAQLDGTPDLLGHVRGRPALFVNVASRCGLTPQYAVLEQLQERLADRPFTVVGFPCNQFMGQEPGSADEIARFCSMTYGVTFPLSEKIEVNGTGRHPLYAELSAVADA